MPKEKEGKHCMNIRFDAVEKEVELRSNELQNQIDRRLRALESEFLARDNALKDVINATNMAQKEAVNKAETAVERRLEGMNEFRNSLTDQNKTFVLREVSDQQFAELKKQIQQVTDRVNLSTGKDEGVSGYRTVLISIILILVGLATVISPHIH